ncbi:hypothetical protein MY11210_008494 [Beauveria gryllotalpidicola]
MAFGRILMATLAAAPLVACHPASKLANILNRAATTLGEDSLFSTQKLTAVYVPEVVAWDEEDKEEDIDDDMEQIAAHYSVIRVHGTACDQAQMMYKKVSMAKGLKLFLGIWEPFALFDEANKIIAGINGDWDVVHTASVGNELVDNGYKGPVVTLDTFMAVQAHPELCDASGYCAMNANLFFDGTITASKAGRWLVETIDRVKSVLSTSKRVVITETGPGYVFAS